MELNQPERNGNEETYKEIEQFSNEKLMEENSQEENEEDIFIAKPYQSPQQNSRNIQIIIEAKYKPNPKKNINNQNTASATKISKIKNKRKDNKRKQYFFIVMIFLKQFFLKFFDLDFSSFICADVLGISIRYMKFALKLKIYQLFCHYKENINKILDVLHSNISNNKKKMFAYFMTRTYEELYNRYINGDKNFPITNDVNLKIRSFITYKSKLKEKEENNADEEEINEFKELSLNMINDIKDENLERKKLEENPINVVILKELEDWRKCFKEDIHYDDECLGLEE